MVSAARIVDRGRLLLGFLLVAPLGVLIGAPILSTPAAPQSQWIAQNGPTDGGAVAGAPTAGDILARFTAAPTPAQGQAAAAAAGLVEEGGETEATSAPDGYVPGTPPTADLAATLRQSEQRFQATQGGIPQSTDPLTRAAALAGNRRMIFTRASQVTDLTTGSVDPRLVDLLLWITTRRSSITITSMRTDHSTCVAGSNPCRVSAHKAGRAVDIAAVDGQACTGVPGSACGVLYEELVNTLRGTPYQPSQLIHGYDPWPSESWNFAMGNHHDHIHIGY